MPLVIDPPESVEPPVTAPAAAAPGIVLAAAVILGVGGGTKIAYAAAGLGRGDLVAVLVGGLRTARGRARLDDVHAPSMGAVTDPGARRILGDSGAEPNRRTVRPSRCRPLPRLVRGLRDHAEHERRAILVSHR